MTDREGRESELRRDAEAPSAEELVEQAHAGVVGRRDALNVIAQLVVALQVFMGEMEALLTAAGRQIAAGPQVAESASAAATEISGSAQEAAARPKEAARSRRRHLPGEQGEPVQIHDEPSELDDAYYDEVRQAVGHGAPSVLLGTSTRSLTQTLDKIKAVEQGSPSARVVYQTKKHSLDCFGAQGFPRTYSDRGSSCKSHTPGLAGRSGFHRRWCLGTDNSGQISI